MTNEIYATYSEKKAYDLAGQMALANCRSHVSHREAHEGSVYSKQSMATSYYVVICDAPEAIDRAIEIRKQMFGQ